jgi:hypothetical protein
VTGGIKIYEQEKKRLEKLNLTAEQYEREIKKLINKLKL